VEAGALARMDLLDAERNSFQAQLDEVTAARDRLLSQVAVMKALGGGHAGAVSSSGSHAGANTSPGGERTAAALKTPL